MQKNSENFSIEDAKRLANSPAGQQLLAYLQQKDAGALNRAMTLAAKGDQTQLKQALATMMNSPEVQALMKQLGG